MSPRPAPLRHTPVGPGRREPMPEPTIENAGDPTLPANFVERVIPDHLRCPWCRTPFEYDDDRYFANGCLDCGWRRANEARRVMSHLRAAA